MPLQSLDCGLSSFRNSGKLIRVFKTYSTILEDVFNCLPTYIRNTLKCSVEHFKICLDTLLKSIEDIQDLQITTIRYTKD